MNCRQLIYCFLFYSAVMCSICFSETTSMNLTSLSSNVVFNNVTTTNTSNVEFSITKDNHSESNDDQMIPMTTDKSSKSIRGNYSHTIKETPGYVMNTTTDKTTFSNYTNDRRDITTRSMTLSTQNSTIEMPIAETLVIRPRKSKLETSTVTLASRIAYSTGRTSSTTKESSENTNLTTSSNESENMKPFVDINSTDNNNYTDDKRPKSTRQTFELHQTSRVKLITASPRHHRHKINRHNYHELLQHKTMHHLGLVPIEDGPFGSLVWKDKKYLISVLIPIAIGIIGAICIIGMTYTARFCHKYELKLRDIKSSSSRQTQPCTDQITLLSDSDEV